MTGNLARLPALGQSPWLDNLQRRMLSDGSLAALISRGIRGLTSNPTIFQKAIQGSDDYDEQFFSLIASGTTPEDAYWELVIADIRAAAELLSGVHAQSDGTDGHVSVEVDPRLAHDTEGTLHAARALDEKTDCPNVMIKIPATRAGLPAIRTMISEGRNVNVTLIFSLGRYEDVMETYIAGLEDRFSAGLPVSGIASVASFFISRVDSEIDARLDAIGTDEASGLKGTAAVSQARLAYESFRTTFSGERWDRLARHGAQVQRPLWASTSTKNPAYPDTLYVDSLIGPSTVNTLPDATLEAFDDHGTVARTIDVGLQGARERWAALERVGVGLREVADKLESEGVASFIKSFEDLLGTLRAKSGSSGTV